MTFSTVLGDDRLKDFVLEGPARRRHRRARPIIDPTRPTINKNAIVAGGYRLLKVDTLDNRSISDDVLDQMTQAMRDVPADAVVCSRLPPRHIQPAHNPAH